MSEPQTAAGPNLETPLAVTERNASTEFGEYFGVRLPAHFGDPFAEYRAARDRVALLDTNFRAVFALTGPDRVRYLNAVTSGNISAVRPGQTALGLLLNAQGHMLAELVTLALEDHLLVLSHQFVRQRTFEALDKFIIMDDATLIDKTAETGTLAVEGPKAPEIVRKIAGVEIEHLPPGGHERAEMQGRDGVIPCRILRHSQFGSCGAEFLIPRESLAQAWEGLAKAVRTEAGSPIGYCALDMLRLEAGIPWFGRDFDEHQIPQEAGVESTHISFTKGCYTGQEIVERVRSRGHVNRRLSGLKFGSAEPPQRGTAILAADGTDAGHVTSAAFSPLAESAIGMGYLRREYFVAGTKLRCGESTAEAIQLPLDKPASPAAC